MDESPVVQVPESPLRLPDARNDHIRPQKRWLLQAKGGTSPVMILDHPGCGIH
jgi:hypothetical protein